MVIIATAEETWTDMKEIHQELNRNRTEIEQKWYRNLTEIEQKWYRNLTKNEQVMMPGRQYLL